RPLFPDAPDADEAVRETACGFRWDAADEPEPALEDWRPLAAEWAAYVGPSCERVGTAAGTGTAVLLGPVNPPDPGGAPPSSSGGDDAGIPPTGVSGCDVCGRVKGDVLYVVRQTGYSDMNTAIVKTTTSSTMAVKVTPPAPKSEAF